MQIWGREDIFGRRVQGLCGVVCVPTAVLLLWSDRNSLYRDGFACGLLYVGVRCFWYAVTGQGNINRENF